MMSISLPRLKRVDICEWTASSPLPHYQQDTLRIMATRMRLLEKICLFHNHLGSEEIAAIYQVNRTDSRKKGVELIKTYQLVEGGPYIKDRRRVRCDSLDWEDDSLLE